MKRIYRVLAIFIFILLAAACSNTTSGPDLEASSQDVPKMMADDGGGMTQINPPSKIDYPSGE